jgi:hypothetical protein
MWSECTVEDPAEQMDMARLLNTTVTMGAKLLVTKGKFYDESYKQLDEWLDGRADVDLGGTCRFGGGCGRY